MHKDKNHRFPQLSRNAFPVIHVRGNIAYRVSIDHCECSINANSNNRSFVLLKKSSVVVSTRGISRLDSRFLCGLIFSTNTITEIKLKVIFALSSDNHNWYSTLNILHIYVLSMCICSFLHIYISRKIINTCRSIFYLRFILFDYISINTNLHNISAARFIRFCTESDRKASSSRTANYMAA